MKNIAIILVLIAIGLSAQHTSFQYAVEGNQPGGVVVPPPPPTPEIQLEIERINQAYAAMPRLFMEVEYNMFAQHDAAQVIENERGTMWKSEGGQWSKLGSVESLITAEYVVQLDHEDEELMLDRRRDSASVKQNPLGIELAALLENCDSVSLSDVSPGVRMLRLDWPTVAIEKTEVYFDKESHKLLKVSIFYAEEMTWEETDGEELSAAAVGRMDVVFLKQQPNPTFPRDAFSIARFVQKTDGKFAPASAFADYSFFDTTNY